MSLFKRLTLLSSVFMFTVSVHGANSESSTAEPDIQSLQDWINSKRMITVKELGGQLSISGDVHSELQVANRDSSLYKGIDKANHFHNYYDVEFNLNIDYRSDYSWLAARVRFDNDAGIFNPILGSGTKDKIKVDRAYFGYRLLDTDQHTTDLEIGRKGPLTSLFDSRVQFASNFDGIAVKDSYAIDNVGDLYYHIGAFIVDSSFNVDVSDNKLKVNTKNQAALVAETGLLNIANTGLYTKYSIIDWDTQHFSKQPDQFHFVVSQMTLGYKCYPMLWKKPTVFYAAGLYNHRAKPIDLTNNKKVNAGGYFGFSLGSMKQAGDWAFDANYQMIGAQCIPDFDVSGIGFAYEPKQGFYLNGDTPVTSPKLVQGNVNYKGLELSLQYLLTNNLNLFQAWRQSSTLDKDIGSHQKHHVYELDLIYSF